MFLVKIEGQGGHAPHATVDPIVAASCTILVLQQLNSRETDPIQSQVLSVTYLRGETALNVVPSYVEFGGTLRSLTTQGLKQLQKRLKAVLMAEIEVLKTRMDVHRSKINIKPKVFDPAISKFFVQLPRKLQNCLQARLMKFAEDSEGENSASSVLRMGKG